MSDAAVNDNFKTGIHLVRSYIHTLRRGRRRGGKE
jgi:hypothetical protein